MTHHPSCLHLEPSVLQAVLYQITTGVSNAQIYTHTGVTRCCTASKQLNLAYWGQPYALALVKTGRPRMLRERHRTQLCKYLAGRPHAYLEEIKDWLLEEFGVEVGWQMGRVIGYLDIFTNTSLN